MSSNTSSICEQSSSVKKRKLHEPVSYIKKLRSKIPRKKRFQIAPILTGFDDSLAGDNEPEFSVTQVVSSSSCLNDEISSSSDWIIPVGSLNLKKSSRSNRRKREAEEKLRGLQEISGEECRRLTRSYYRKKLEEKLTEKENLNRGIELSESSCVESFSGVEARVLRKVDEFSERNLKLNARASREAEQEVITEGDAASAEVVLSETSCIQPFSVEIISKNCKSGKVAGKTSVKKPKNSAEIQVNDAVVTSEVQNLCSSVHDIGEKVTTNKVRNRAEEASFLKISKDYVESKLEIANSESTADQIPKEFEYDYNLACSEHFSFEEGSENSPFNEMTLSELESDIFPRIPNTEFSSDYTPSLLIESGSEFSEKSPGNSTPPDYFSFFLQYSKQFSKLSSSEEEEMNKASKRVQEEYFDEFTLLRFEDEFHEDSYKKFRCRERNHVVLHDYAEKYFSATDYGDLVLQQRMVMVNWIVEQSNERDLHYETMFLGVSLLDRFLSQGFFRSKRKLQVLGIACLALATRIEENQPYNCIRQKTFRVGNNGYIRPEIVAMEWLVQEVLNFQCFLPTIYNFLWFYLKAARANDEVEKRARYLAVLSLLDHERLCYWPSTVAAGLVILAALAADQEASCQLIMETHVRTKKDDLSECIKSLEWLVKYVC